MHSKLFFLTLLLFIFLAAIPAHLSANEFDYHILNAGINLGWAEAVAELMGVNDGTTPYLSAVLANATAHLAEAQNQINGTMWEFIQLTSVNNEIDQFINNTRGWNSGQQAAQIRSILGRIRAKLAQYFVDGRTFLGPTCPSNLLMAGSHFGRAHIGKFLENESYHSAARGSFINAVNDGLEIAPIRSCDFATLEKWNALPYKEPFSMAVYADTLYPMQVLAWELNGLTTPPPAPAPPSLPPLPSDPSSGLSGIWIPPDNARLEFKRSSTGFVGRVYQTTEAYRGWGISDGDILIEITSVTGNRYSGRLRWLFNNDEGLTWTDITITVTGDTAQCQSPAIGSWTMQRLR